jgi:hypothetical protein
MLETLEAIRFRRETLNRAKFWLVVYTAKIEYTKPSLLRLKKYLDTAQELTTNPAIGQITISSTVGCSPYETLSMSPFGSIYFDPTNIAHEKAGMNKETGGVMILRQNGLLGFAGHIDGPWNKAYFENIMDL